MNDNSIIVVVVDVDTVVFVGAHIVDVSLLAFSLFDQLPVLLQEQSVASP